MKLFKSSFSIRFSVLLDALPLSRLEKEIVRQRYLKIVEIAESEYRVTQILFLLLSNVITIASVLITAFVSFDRMSTGNSALLWTTWGLSIALTLANKWMYSFNINKKYVLNVAFLQKLHSEGWCFVAGTGRYDELDYGSRFKVFCQRIEKLKLKCIESMPEMSSADSVGEMLAAASANAVTQSREIPREGILEDNMADDSTDFVINIGETVQDDLEKTEFSKNESVITQEKN